VRIRELNEIYGEVKVRGWVGYLNFEKLRLDDSRLNMLPFDGIS
jgi:hypothetical protein